jgi:hypothetical protein
VSDNGTDSTPESINVFTLNGNDLETVTLEGLVELVALQVFGGVSRNGDVIVIKEKLNIQVLGDGKTSSLRIVTLLLGSIRAEQEHSLVLISHSDTVDKRPHMAEATRGEFHARRKTKLGMSRKLGVSSAVVEKVLRRDGTFQGREEVLGSDTVS